MYEHVIYHVPHASMYIPPEYRDDYLLDLGLELAVMTDRLTQDLFDLPGQFYMAGFSRLFCDVERFRDDALEPMAAKGMGALYTKTHDAKPLRELTEERREEILRKFYDPYHRELTCWVDETVAELGRCTIVDCHSFFPEPLPHEADDARPDICIGTDPFHTPPELVEALEEGFVQRGYSVMIDRPFSGTMVPMKHYHTDARVRSVMIEVNRDVYLNERGRMSRRYYGVKRDLRQVLLPVLERLG